MEAQKTQSAFGIASLILGIVGILTVCIIIGIVPAILGLVFAIVGICPKNKKHGIAIAGLICSSVGIGLYVIYIFFAFLIVGSDSSNVDTNTGFKNDAIESTVNNNSFKQTDSNQFEYNGMVVKYLRHEISTDYKDTNILIVYYEFTNRSDENKVFDYSFSDKCFQNGVEIEHTYFHANNESKNSGKEIKPGASVVVASSFSVGDCLDDVELEVEPYVTFKENILLSLDLKLE